jgi:hypothetical protein
VPLETAKVRALGLLAIEQAADLADASAFARGPDQPHVGGVEGAAEPVTGVVGLRAPGGSLVALFDGGALGPHRSIPGLHGGFPGAFRPDGLPDA